jgi:hypothetical protein
MTWKSGSLRIACLLVALGVAGSAQAQTKYYSVNGGGGQAQIGDGLPLPAQDQISAMGGKNGTGGPIGTYTNFPPLLIPIGKFNKQHPPGMTMTLVTGAPVVKQTNGADPKNLIVPPGVFRRIPAAPLTIGVAVNNPKVLQVRTTLSFSGPAKTLGTMTFKAGQRVNNTTTYNGTPAGSKVVYASKTGNRFGGPSQTRVKNLGVIGVWADLGDIMTSMMPCKHPSLGGTRADCVANKLPAYPMTFGAAGGPKGNIVKTPGTPPAKPGTVGVYIDNMTGKIKSEAVLKATGALNNKATSVGFPWTTGALTISQPAAFGSPEKFHITGMDGRVNGVGTLQLVSSALSKRLATGPNSNRSWAEYQLPEPGAVLGAAGALTMLGVCHALVRRRNR